MTKQLQPPQRRAVQTELADWKQIQCDAAMCTPVGKNEHRAVRDVHLRGRVTGRQRSIARDHDQLVARVAQRAQAGLALWLQRALRNS